VTWFVDDPRTIVMSRPVYASAYTVALTWEKAYCGYLEAVGFPVVHHLPLAADPTVFNGEPAESWDFPPAFVGNSMNSVAESKWACVKEHAELAAEIHRAFEAGRVTRENFSRGLEVLLDADVLDELDEEARRHAELVFFVEGTRRLRHALVRLLEPEGLEVYGDAAWRQVTPKAKGPVNYTHDLPGLYRRCEINLNSTSIQMPETANQRVFDCPAAGGFLLTDAQKDLFDLFDVKREVACYSSPEECIELFRAYRKNPMARRDIAARARKRVLGEHTYAHRLQRIVAIVKERFGSRQAVSP